MLCQHPSMPGKPAKPTTPTTSATPAAYRPGDIVFWSIDRVSGEAMVIGHDAKDANTLVVLVGAQVTELNVANCSPTSINESRVGASYRREYMTRFPGKLK